MEKLTGSPSLHSLVVTPSKSFNVISVPGGIFTFLGTKVKLEVSSITFKASNTHNGFIRKEFLKTLIHSYSDLLNFHLKNLNAYQSSKQSLFPKNLTFL